jgi:cytochrome c oxidase cbb3-type subunit 2
VYDHPFVWGSKRTGPDLARVGERCTAMTGTAHTCSIRAPWYPAPTCLPIPWLFETPVDSDVLPRKLAALRSVGVPYTDDDIATASAGLEAMTEADAVIAYLQQLGTLITERR